VVTQLSFKEAQNLLCSAIEADDPGGIVEALKQGADAAAPIKKYCDVPAIWLAVACSRLQALQCLLEHKREYADVKYNGFSTLHFACDRNNSKAVRLLVEAGADALIRSEGLNLHTRCLLRLQGECANILPGAREAQAVIRSKLLAHTSGLQGIGRWGNLQVALPGFCVKKAHEKFLQYLREYLLAEPSYPMFGPSLGAIDPNFFDQGKYGGLSPSLVNAFKMSLIVKHRDSEELVRRFKTNESLIISTGYLDHTMALVFWKRDGLQYLAICDPSISPEPGFIFRRLKREIDRGIVGAILAQQWESPERAKKFFYGELLERIAHQEMDLCSVILSQVITRCRKSMKGGFCSWRATKMALLVLIFVFSLLKQEKWMKVEDGNRLFRDLSTYMRIRSLQEYCAFLALPGHQYLMGRKLAETAFQKLASRLVRNEKEYFQRWFSQLLKCYQQRFTAPWMAVKRLSNKSVPFAIK
jgi:hypothetical protein